MTTMQSSTSLGASHIDADSTAVLAFDDGARVPCDRFIMRMFCDVVRTMLQNVLCDLDARGRCILPMPMQPSAPYWLAVEVLHGIRSEWSLSYSEVTSVLPCMEFLGATAQEAALETRLWALLHAAPLEELLPHAARLLRNPVVGPATVRRLVKLKPLWLDFYIDVLLTFGGDVDPTLVNTVVKHASLFFPPFLVANWAVTATMKSRQGVKDADLIRVVSQRGAFSHPRESAVLMRRLGDALTEPELAGFVKHMATSMDRYDALPWSANLVHGSMLTVAGKHGLTSMCLMLEGLRLPPSVKLTPWFKVTFCSDGRFDVVFSPRRMDPTTKSVQLRIMCLDSSDPLRGACGESWHAFDVPSVVEPAPYSLTHATSSTPGGLSGIFHLLRLNPARILRFDFFHRAFNVLDCPFDVKVPLAVS